MSEFTQEIRLLHCLLLNAMVFGSAWFFARRRLTTSRSQALLDAALLGYAIQYIAVGIPGLLGYINVSTVTAVSIACSVCLLASTWKIKPETSTTSTTFTSSDRFIVIGWAIFAVTFIVAFAHKQADLPVISNDAMTYHFPAAVQWMQQGRIGLFQAWFFNPSNTYSPLAGSIFILWLLLPVGSDVLARFVEVPALLCVGIATYRLCRQMRVRATIAAPIAAATVLCRPIFLPCMMGKDDLFVAFFILAGLVALAKDRADERWGPVRFGSALGLLFATKYTALLSVPILLLAIDGPKWSLQKWIVAAMTAFVLAGPWYIRNWVLTRNPFFPLGSLFTSARSEAFSSMLAAGKSIVGGVYGMPMVIAIFTVAAAIGCIVLIVQIRFKKREQSPIVRACSIGALLTIALFFWRSPFPEVRFVLPAFCLLFGCTAFCIERWCRNERLAIALGIVMASLSISTLFAGFFVAVAVPFTAVSLLAAGTGIAGMAWIGTSRIRKQLVAAILLTAFFMFAYINWAGFCRYQQQTRFVEGAGYSVEYPELTRLWDFVDQHIPADATAAYTNLYFVYPLQGGTLQRRIVYAPTRRGLNSISDLGWLGNNLPGEKLVRTAIWVTAASPDREVWLSNLQKSKATYLIVGRSNLIDVPTEIGFAAADSSKFTLLYEGSSGWVYQINAAN